MSLFARGVDGTLMDLVEEAGRNVQRCGLLLRELLVDYPEHTDSRHPSVRSRRTSDRTASSGVECGAFSG